MDKTFSDEEKRELRQAARSETIRKDFQRVSRNRITFTGRNGSPDIDRIIRFLADTHTLFNHPSRPFKKITGNNFRM